MNLKSIPLLFNLLVVLTFLLNSLVCISGNIHLSEQNDYRQADVEIILTRAKDLQRKSPAKALEMSEQAIQLIKTGGSDTLLAEAFFQKAYAFFILGENDSSLALLNHILSMPEAKTKTKARALDLLCIEYRKAGKSEMAVQCAHRAKKLYLSINDSAGMTKALIDEAKVYHYQGNNKKAMSLYMNALQYMEKTNDTLETGLLYGLIANVYMDLEQVDKGKAYYRKSIGKLHNYENTLRYADIVNNYGIAFYDEGIYDSALFYYNRALNVYQSTGQQDAVAVSYQNIGITYIFLNEINKGLDYLHRAYQLFSRMNLPNDQASVLIDLGTAFIQINQPDSAGFYLKQALAIADSLHHGYYKKTALFALHKLFEKAGDYQKALLYYVRYTAYKDSLENQAMKENLQELEIKYQTAQRENEIIRLKDQEMLDKTRTRLLVTGLVGLFIAFVLTVIMFLQRRKKDKIIHQQKILVHKKEKDLAKAEAARREAHAKQLENELEFKTRQLASHALNMMQKNKLLHEITEDIEKRVQSSDCKGPEAMLQVKRSLQQGLNVDKDWDLFKLYFEQVNKDFFQSLKKINGKLTSNDFKLAALIKLNMSIKEMASVLNISPASLKNARYRLKKKLNLNDEESLTRVIRDL